NFVFSFACNGNRGNVRIAAKAVAILCAARELNDFECASQVHVQALLFRFAVQRSGAVNQGVRGVHQRMVFVIAEAKTLAGESAAPRVGSPDQSSVRGSRDSSGRPSISG